jgi:hypothetical protein
MQPKVTLPLMGGNYMRRPSFKIVAIIVCVSGCVAKAEEIHLRCEFHPMMVYKGNTVTYTYDITDVGVTEKNDTGDVTYITNIGPSYFRKDSSVIAFGIGNSNGSPGRFEYQIDRATGEYRTFSNGMALGYGKCAKVEPTETSPKKF